MFSGVRMRRQPLAADCFALGLLAELQHHAKTD
jgi:hypothetical protein